MPKRKKSLDKKPAARKKKPAARKKKLANIIKIAELVFGDYDLTRVGISQSMINSFLACPRKFLLSVNRWTSTKKQLTTSFGSMFHEMLDKVYNKFMNDGVIASPAQIDMWLEKYIEKVSKKGYDKVGKANLELQAGMCQVIVEEYITFYAEDFTEKEFVWAEKVFDFLDHQNVRRRGKIDAKFRTHGKPWLMEHKTKGRINEDQLMLKLAFDFQNLYYIAADEGMSGDKIAGMLYNVIRKPGHKRRGGESIKQFSERIRKDIQKRPEHFFKRYEVPYTEKDKREFAAELVTIFQQIQSVVKGHTKVYRNQTSCVGMFSCNYLSACASGNLTGYTQKESLFTELESDDD